MLTIKGKAALVVQDSTAYQAMLDVVDRAEAIAGIQRGINSMERKEGQPEKEVFARLRKAHKISPE